MKPHRTIRALSSLHREAGGLRRLDFFVDRAENWAGEKERKHISLLILGWQKGAIALPFASLGYRVTVLEPGATTVELARATGQELGLNIECVVGSVSALGNRKFDLIIADFMQDLQTSFSSFAELRAQLAIDGNLFSAIPRRGENSRWRDFQKHLRESGWRLREACGAGVIRVRKIDSGIARFLESLDNWLIAWWPLKFARGWLAELESCASTKPYVIHLLPGLGIGGAEKLVYELVARLPAFGYDAKAVAMIEGGPLEKNFRERGLPLEIILRRDRFGLSTLKDLSRLFFLQKPDIVHTHLFGADAWGRLAAFWQRVPVVISTDHNTNPTYGRVQHFVNWLFAKKTTALIAISETVKKTMIKNDGIAKKKIHTIVNGIDVESVVQRGGRPFQDTPRLIIVGRLFPQKDHATLFKALALVKSPWRLRVVGSGPLEGELRSLAERLGIASRIEWLGVRRDVAKLLADSDLFCFPSRWEGLGLVALEASVAGVPIIASDLPALREIFTDKDIYYAPAGDVSAWSRALNQILSGQAEAILKAMRTAPMIRAKAGIDKMVSEYAEIYTKAINKLK